MSKSHAAGRPSDPPTLAQLRELLRQAESGRVTKDGLQEFLRGEPKVYGVARALLRGNFFGVEHWETFYGVDLIKRGKKVCRRLAVFPWSEEVLEGPDPWESDRRVCDTHFGFLGVDLFDGRRLNLPLWCQLNSGPGRPNLWGDWWLEHEFAQKTCELRWYLMRIGVVPESRNLHYDPQVRRLPNFYEVPLAVERVTANILFYLLHGVYLDQQYLARCRDLTDRCGRVGVQGFFEHGVKVERKDTTGIHCRLGIAASRKSPSWTWSFEDLVLQASCFG